MAMAVVYTPFSEISNGKNSWNIIAKVIRMWVVSDFVKHKIPFSLEMVLLDQEGNRIHAYVKRTLVYKFVNDIKEGSVYSIENLAVAPNVGSFRTNRHAWKLMFQFTSKVQIMGGDRVHGEAYELVPISQLTVPDVDTDYLVDVVGLLTGVGTERQIERNGVKTKLNVISLEEDGHKIECTLFGPYVDELNAFLASGEVENAVVILQFAKVKLFQEKINLQNCMSCTKLIFNPTCQAAVKLRQRMSATLESPTQGLSQLSEPTKISLEEEFLQLTPGTTVAGLKHLDEEGLFVVYATITDIVTGTWWYTSCVCSKAVFPDSDMYFCEKCYKHVMKVVPRYCIKVCVGDVTGDTVFVIFDNVGRVLLNRTAAELFEAEDKISGNHAIPEEICNLKGKTFLFKVELKKQSNSLFGQSFRVKKICADESIIQKFKDEMNKPLDLSPVSGFVSDGKEKMIEGSSKSISEDLLPKFLTAGIEECSQTVEGKGKDVQVVEEEVTKLSNDEVVTPVKNVVVFADSQVELVTPLSIGYASQVPIDLDNDMDPFTPLKRVSPSEIEKADDHVPLKMLKKTIKIEKD